LEVIYDDFKEDSFQEYEYFLNYVVRTFFKKKIGTLLRKV